MAHYALVPAAGSGSRFGGELPKQYLMLHGKPLLQHALDRLLAQFPLARLYVVLGALFLVPLLVGALVLAFAVPNVGSDLLENRIQGSGSAVRR